MKTNPRIKVIKRGEKQLKTAVRAAKNKTAQSTAREMVATVTDWVAEFQEKRREETQEALHHLFPQAPKPSGCTNF